MSRNSKSEITPVRKTYMLRAWLIWLLSAFFMFYKNVLEISPSVMNNALMSSFDITGAGLGNLAASYFYAYLFLQIPAGLLLDKIGPRKVTTVAIALCALGTILFAEASNFGLAMVGRFLTGVGAAFAAVNCLKLIANWFPPKQFAFMSGLMMTIAMLGAVGGQAPLAALIDVFAWREAIKLIGFVGIVFAILFWLIVRDKAPSHKQDKLVSTDKISLLESFKKVINHKQSWMLSLYSGLAFSPVMVFGGLWGVSFMEEAFTITKNLAAQSVSLIFIGFALGAPLLGWFSDWLGSRKIVIFWGTLVALFSITAVIYIPSLSHILLNFFLFLFGFSISSFLLSFTMIRETHKAMLAATAAGFMNAFNALFGALADPLAGKFLDMTWSGKIVDGARVFSLGAYKAAFLIIPISLVLALLSLLLIRETCSNKPSPPSTLP
ncbi:MAG: MFS transporter [Verrucomicrobia bacterium]|nr:MFS transporter [Verrucomicrobiota bacterium]